MRHSPLSTLNFPLSTIHSPLSTLNFPLSTLHSQLSTLHSQLLFCPFRAKTFLNLNNNSTDILRIFLFFD
ncbi:MAG: hypothetical protein LBE12_11540 [Planctomycetaceae bacterium]|nr:hypothetical protein [Planctomycetaceae bacterium]